MLKVLQQQYKTHWITIDYSLYNKDIKFIWIMSSILAIQYEGENCFFSVNSLAMLLHGIAA